MCRNHYISWLYEGDPTAREERRLAREAAAEERQRRLAEAEAAEQAERVARRNYIYCGVINCLTPEHRRPKGIPQDDTDEIIRAAKQARVRVVHVAELVPADIEHHWVLDGRTYCQNGGTLFPRTFDSPYRPMQVDLVVLDSDDDAVGMRLVADPDSNNKEK